MQCFSKLYFYIPKLISLQIFKSEVPLRNLLSWWIQVYLFIYIKPLKRMVFFKQLILEFYCFLLIKFTDLPWLLQFLINDILKIIFNILIMIAIIEIIVFQLSRIFVYWIWILIKTSSSDRKENYSLERSY